MKVLLTANVMNDDCVGNPGDVVEVRDEIGKGMIEQGLALKAPDEEKPVERAVADKRETATHPAQKK